MKKVILVLVTVLLLAGVIVYTTGDTTIPIEGETELRDGQILIIDAADREVILDKEAETIVSSYYITTYATIALGVEDKVIGLEKKAETRPIYALASPSLLGVTQVGSLKEFNIEAVAELKPDIVLMPIRLLEQAETLEGLGIKTLIVDPETQEGLVEMLQIIGKATGSTEQANNLFLAYDEMFAKIDVMTEGKEKPVVYMGSNSSFLESATADMYQNFLISKAGGVNAFGEIDKDYWTAVSYEGILAKNPDFIIIPTAASYDVEDVMNDEQLKDVKAVIDGNVYMMPTGYEEWDSPVPSGILGIYWLATVLHGDENSDTAFVDEVVEFYKEFYGFQVQ